MTVEQLPLTALFKGSTVSSLQRLQIGSEDLLPRFLGIVGEQE
jgi:hypothetical protein